jgi:hypothetical protein
MAINFTLSGLNATMTMDVSGTLAGEAPAVLDVSAVAVYYVKTADMVNVFRFQTDSFDVSDLSASDIKYYVFRDSGNWPEALKLNPAHSAMDASFMLLTDVPANKNLVKHDFVRYLASKLFNTVHGVDLFSNETALLEDIATKGATARAAIELALDNVNTTKTADGALTSAADASGNRYTTNALTGPTNICRELMRQIANGAPSRFNATVASPYNQSVPLITGDTINFKVTIAPASLQHDLTGVAEIPSRSYRIKLILSAVDGSGNVTPTNVAPVDSSGNALEYPYSA